MNIQDIANLIHIRNYAIGVVHNRTILPGDSYKKMNAKLRELEEKITSSILTMSMPRDLSDERPALEQKQTVLDKPSKPSKRTVKAK